MRPRPRPEPKAEPEKKSWKDHAKEHLGLLLTGGFALFTVLHIFFVALYDPTTALAIVSVADRPGILISTAAQLLSVAALYAFVDPTLLSWTNREFNRAKTFSQHVPPALVFVFALPLAVAQLSVLWIVLIVVIRVGLHRRRKKAAQRGALAPDGRIFVTPKQFEWGNLFLAVFALSLLVTNLAVPWTTKEALGLEAGTPSTVVGYVMGESSGQMLVLSAKNRSATWIPVDDINSRQVCVDSAYLLGWLTDTVGQFIARAKYEVCPSPPPIDQPARPMDTTPGTTTPSSSPAPPSP
jgi:hypothetical protein